MFQYRKFSLDGKFPKRTCFSVVKYWREEFGAIVSDRRPSTRRARMQQLALERNGRNTRLPVTGYDRRGREGARVADINEIAGHATGTLDRIRGGYIPAGRMIHRSEKQSGSIVLFNPFVVERTRISTRSREKRSPLEFSTYVSVLFRPSCNSQLTVITCVYAREKFPRSFCCSLRGSRGLLLRASRT